jgi:phosphosulfolactate phosphohydrolase-like enzyme
MATKKTVRIDVLPESAWRYSGYDAIVCVDVLLSATTVVSALGQGRRVLLAPDAEQAVRLSASLEAPLLLTDDLASADDASLRFAGAAFLATDQTLRALVHVSPLAGMLAAAAQRGRVYVACLRNFEATANELALQHKRVVVIGAGEAGEVCAADQMATAWLALRLQGRDFELEGRHTNDEVARWGPSDVAMIGLSRSAERLRARGRESEVTFVLRHVNDLDVVCGYADGELHDPVAKRKREVEETPTPAWGTRSPLAGGGRPHSG